MGTERRGHGGQVVPLLAVIVVAAGAASILVGRLGGAAVARARAVTAADAAALAGAAAGPAAARELARHNGGRVVHYEAEGSDAEVEVELGAAVARARARRAGGDDGGPAPGLRAALARAAQLLGTPVPTVAAPAGDGPQPAAPRRWAGMAVDVAPGFVERLLTVASRAGLCRPYPRALPGHFELCGEGQAAGLP
ncbi:MAG TPA: hypothetical protein VM264_02100 [Acidimicrobiales bacterium]|nr:hypothetical protein [Acidimicrobiales bacterium]